MTDLIVNRLPRSIDVQTDIVGNPIYSNFNVTRYLWVYGLWVLFFPFAAVAMDVALARLTRRRLPVPDWPVFARGAATRVRSRGAVAEGLARTGFVGLVLAVELSLGAVLEGGVFLLGVTAATAFYVAAAAMAALALPDRSRPLWERLTTVNIVGCALTVLGLYAVSRATQVQVLDNGRVFEYPWLPLWLAAAATALVVAVLVHASRRAADPSALREVERWSLLLVAAPILLFLVIARLPGEIGPIDFFHEGELAAAADLTAEGALPWRDLMFVHGFLHDVVSPWIGFSVFEETRWGMFAGLLMLVGPAYFLAQYLLFVYLFREDVVFLVGAQVAVVLGLFAGAHFRFILMPIALLLVAALLREPSWWWAAALAVVLVAQAIVSPETTIAIPALVGIVALFELWSYDRARALIVNFRRTAQLVISGIASLAVLSVGLAAFGVLDDFAFFYRTFLTDHALTGGIPVQWSDRHFDFAAFAPPIAVITTIWFFATARRAGWTPRIDDWVMAGLALTLLLYYPKFLSRADYPHLNHVLPVAAPLIAYAAYRVLSLFRGRWWSAWVTGTVVVTVAFLAPIPVLDRAEEIPARVSVEAHTDPVPPRLGFLSPNATSLEMIRDVDWILDHYLEPDEPVFDFSNNPFLFHYLVERRSASRYFHVSMAPRRHTQRDLIAELERRKPRLVVSATSLRVGFPAWDGISNQVRHYDVSEYILDNYRPLFESQGFVFMVRNGSSLRPPSPSVRPLFDPPTTRGLYLKAVPCEWGYAPNFLSTGPTAADMRRGVELRPRRVEGVYRLTGWAADLKATAPAHRVVAALGRRVYGAAVPLDERLDVAGGLGDPRFARSGFTIVFPAVVPLTQLRFYGLTRDGTARELVYAPQSGLAPLSTAPDHVSYAGRRYRVIPGGIHGWAETATPERTTVELNVPAGTKPADYDWLEIRTKTRFESDTFGITDRRGEPKRTISFSTLDRGQKVVQIQLSACSQWRGFGSTLYLESGTGQEIEIRLIP